MTSNKGEADELLGKLQSENPNNTYILENYKGSYVVTETYAEGGSIHPNFHNTSHYLGTEVTLVRVYNGDEMPNWDDDAQATIDFYKRNGKRAMVVHKGGNLHGMYVEKFADGGWIQDATAEMKKKGTVGSFTKMAKRHGDTPVEYAKDVLDDPSKHTLKTRRKAQFVKNTNPDKFDGGGKIPKKWKNSDVTVYNKDEDEFYGVEDVAYSKEDDVLDKGHPYLVMGKSEVKYEDFAKGGLVSGTEIEFRHGRDDKIKRGQILNVLGDGEYAVMSGFSQMLVRENEILGVAPEQNKRWYQFEDGGVGYKKMPPKKELRGVLVSTTKQGERQLKQELKDLGYDPKKVDRLTSNQAFILKDRYSYADGGVTGLEIKANTPLLEKIQYTLNEWCKTFVVIGTPNETPRYSQLFFTDGAEGKGEAQLQSTQKKLYYPIYGLTEEENRFLKRIQIIQQNRSRSLWNQYKEIRTEFLLEYYPTIDVYKDGGKVNGEVIIDKHPQGHWMLIDELSYQVGDDFEEWQDAYEYAKEHGIAIKKGYASGYWDSNDYAKG